MRQTKVHPSLRVDIWGGLGTQRAFLVLSPHRWLWKSIFSAEVSETVVGSVHSFNDFPLVSAFHLSLVGAEVCCFDSREVWRYEYLSITITNIVMAIWEQKLSLEEEKYHHWSCLDSLCFAGEFVLRQRLQTWWESTPELYAQRGNVLSPSFFQIPVNFLWTSDLLSPLVPGNMTRASISQHCYMLKLFPCCFPQREPETSIDLPLCSIFCMQSSRQRNHFNSKNWSPCSVSHLLPFWDVMHPGWADGFDSPPWPKTLAFITSSSAWFWLDQLQTRVCALPASKHHQVSRLFKRSFMSLAACRWWLRAIGEGNELSKARNGDVNMREIGVLWGLILSWSHCVDKSSQRLGSVWQV